MTDRPSKNPTSRIFIWQCAVPFRDFVCRRRNPTESSVCYPETPILEFPLVFSARTVDDRCMHVMGVIVARGIATTRHPADVDRLKRVGGVLVEGGVRSCRKTGIELAELL